MGSVYTTSPNAIARPAITMVFTVAPRQCSTSGAVISDNGIAVRLITAVRHVLDPFLFERYPPKVA